MNAKHYHVTAADRVHRPNDDHAYDTVVEALSDDVFWDEGTADIYACRSDDCCYDANEGVDNTDG